MNNKIRGYFNDCVLDKAAACFNVNTTELKELDGFENFIYEFEQKGIAYILRISHTSRRTREMIDAEMHWIDYLHGCGVNCSIPMKSIHGNLVEVVTVEGQSFVVCAFDKVPGKHLTKEQDTKLLRYNYGCQVGRMHRTTKDYQPGKVQRIHWYQDDLIREFDDIIPPSQHLIKTKMRENTQQIQAMSTNRDNFGLVHFDVHAGNFFVHNEDIYVFDFDDSQYAFFAADIAIVLFYFSGGCPKDRNRDDFIKEFFHDFMQGYNSENHLPAEELAKIPIFLKQRELILYAAIIQAYPDGKYDNWSAWYMNGRKEKLEQDTPFLEYC